MVASDHEASRLLIMKEISSSVGGIISVPPDHKQC